MTKRKTTPSYLKVSLLYLYVGLMALVLYMLKSRTASMWGLMAGLVLVGLIVGVHMKLRPVRSKKKRFKLNFRVLVDWVKKNKKLSIVIAALAVLCVVGNIVSQQLGKVAFRQVLKLNPDLAKIYDVEQTSFPDYTIGVFKGTTSIDGQKDEGPYYAVTLVSGALPDEDQMRAAGKLACQTGLPSGTRVSVTGRRQMGVFYYAFSRNGVCP